MNLSKKKELAMRALKVGRERIVFVQGRLEDIKEAITKQDIRDLHKDKAILVKTISGTKRNTNKKARRSTGNIKKKVKTRKRDYVTMTRKLRAYVVELKKRGELSPEEATEIRKKIRNRDYRSKANLRDYVGGLRKWEQ